MVKATMPSISNTVRNIFMSLYGSGEEVVTVCLVYKIWWLLCSCVDAFLCIFVTVCLVEQVMTMCRVQELQLSLPYFLSYVPLMRCDFVSAP